MAPMSRMVVVLILTFLIGVGFAFFYRPQQPGSRFARLGQRMRTVAYAYVAAVIISAVLRLALGWGV